METTFFKNAFLALMGIAILGLLALATAAAVFWVKVVWLWLRPHLRTTKAGDGSGQARTLH